MAMGMLSLRNIQPITPPEIFHFIFRGEVKLPRDYLAFEYALGHMCCSILAKEVRIVSNHHIISMHLNSHTYAFSGKH